MVYDSICTNNNDYGSNIKPVGEGMFMKIEIEADKATLSQVVFNLDRLVRSIGYAALPHDDGSAIAKVSDQIRKQIDGKRDALILRIF
jgi:hypothetical protein